MTIPEEVPGMFPKDMPQNDQLIAIPSVSGAQQSVEDNQRNGVNSDHKRVENCFRFER